jgi:hypothetical protein
LALSEDPDYAKALYRKVLIMEKKGEFTSGHSIAMFAITRFDHELEEEQNRETVPKFKELRDRLA